MNGQTDLAVLGASLLGMTKALNEAPRSSVRIFEAGPAIGGCWGVEAAVGLDAIENGTHVFFHHLDARASLYQLMSDLFDVNFVPMTPKPCVHGPALTPTFPLEHPGNGLIEKMIDAWADARRGVRSLKNSHRALRYFDKIMKSYLGERLGFTPPSGDYNYLYLEGGMRELLKNATEKIAADQNIALNLDTPIDRIVADSDGGFTLMSTGGEAFRAKNLFLTAGAKIDHIEDQRTGGSIALPFEQHETQHFVFLVREPSPRPFTFVEFLGKPHLRWLTDITEFGSAPPEGCRLLCVRIHKSVGASEDDAVAASIIHNLRQTGHISRRAELLDQKKLSYTTVYRTEDQLKEFNEALPAGAQMVYSRYFLLSLERLIASGGLDDGRALAAAE